MGDTQLNTGGRVLSYVVKDVANVFITPVSIGNDAVQGSTFGQVVGSVSFRRLIYLNDKKPPKAYFFPTKGGVTRETERENYSPL